MLQQISKTGKVTKTVFIIRRYEVKRGTMSGSICNVVRSVKTVKGEQVANEYQVWTHSDGTTTCDCPAHGTCCHQDEVANAAMRRCDSIAPANARRAVVKSEAEQAAELLEQVKVLLPNRRSAEYSKRTTIKPVPTPTVRNVSREWLLNGHRGNGTFSGRVA